jgi:hypothetical protein
MIESIRVLDSTVSGAVDELSEDDAWRTARDLTPHTAAHSERSTTTEIVILLNVEECCVGVPFSPREWR